MLIILVAATMLTAFLTLVYFWKITRSRESYQNNSGGRGGGGAGGNRVCCLYAYYEKNKEYEQNLRYFLKYGLSDDVDFYFIVNGQCSVSFPTQKSNITVLKRENLGYDFGAWQACISKYLNGGGGGRSYDYYFFLNTSVKGPIPAELGGDWVERFLELFEDVDGTKLVGTTINITNDIPQTSGFHFLPPYTHVQSMFFGMDRDAFDFLLHEKGFFNDEEILNGSRDLSYIVIHKEVTMSQLILQNGWNINAMAPKYRGKDYRKVTANFNPSSDNPYRVCGDSPDKARYFGRNIFPEEVIFYKTNLSCV